MNRRILAAALIGALLTAGCSSGQQVQMAPAEQIYQNGMDQLRQANYPLAIANFEFLEARFPFTNQARQAELNLIYAYYRNGEREAAIDAAEQFIRQNPAHPRVDYALYMMGLVYFEGTPGRLDNWLRIDRNVRPPQDAMRSYEAFLELALRFPQSEYITDARERMLYLRNRLAAYEIHVARHYLRRGAYVAALNRARYCLETYAGAPQQRDALEVMLEAYQRLGMTEMANSTREVLAHNWPGAY